MDLHTPINQIPKIGKTTAKKLEKLSLKNCFDALHHYPFRYEDWSKIITIADLKTKKIGTVKVKIKNLISHKTPRRRMVITEAVVSDATDSIKVVWFGQFFLNKFLKPGQEIYLAGKVEQDPVFGLQIVSPAYEFPQKQKAPIHLGRLVPIYPTTGSISPKQIRLLIKEVLPLAQKVEDWMPTEIKNEFQLMNLPYALEQIHFPGSRNMLERATHRLKFDELFLIQLQTQILKEQVKKRKAPMIKNDLEKTKKFVNELPFKLTDSQKKSAWEIIKDLEKEKPMNRLLEGDVGSGKTVVAAMAILNTILNNYQVAYLAPTEILAQQHFNNLSQLFKKWPVKIGLFTRESQLLRNIPTKVGIPTQVGTNSSKLRIKKKDFLNKISNGEVDLIIGTHAILQESVNFKNLGLIIVDEQHRFGVEQRAKLSTQINADQNADKRRSQAQINIDQDTDQRRLLYEDLTYRIRGLLFNVYNELGPSYKEIVYGNAVEEELKKNNIPYEREKIIDIVYNNKKVGIYKPDFIIDSKIVLELKAQSFIGRLEIKQTWYYLKGSHYKLALLINFGSKELQIKRIVYDTVRVNQQKLASGISDNPRLDPRKSAIEVAHFLSMTATPIPRSLALTLYGDLDLSIIDEMPPGRKEVEIKIVGTKEKNKVYESIKEKIKSGQQAFVICPLIESRTNADSQRESASSPRQSAFLTDSQRKSASSQRLSALWDVKAVKQEYEKLSSSIFPDLKLAMLHGKLKAKEKDKIMSAFAKGYGGSSDLRRPKPTTDGEGRSSREGGAVSKKERIDILISTTVIEVGIDVPNATMMLIEGAERFGLAQLWQLKGRIGRSNLQSYCFLFPENPSEKARIRLSAMLNAKNGFELAEKDLEIRGPGEVFGFKQSGYLEYLKIARLSDTQIVKEAQEAVKKIFSLSSSLKKYPQLLKKVEKLEKIIHLE